MQQSKKQYTRRTYFIQKGFQAKMILKIVLLLIIMSFISSVILYFLAGSELKSSYYEAHSNIKSMWDVLGTTVLITNFISLAVVSLATIYVILFISHKIAGPLFRLEKTIHEISEGKLNVHMRLRAGDQITPLATALENMANKLSEKIKVIKDVSGEISKLEETLQCLKEKESISAEEINVIHHQLRDNTIKLNSELESFKLQDPSGV